MIKKKKVVSTCGGEKRKNKNRTHKIELTEIIHARENDCYTNKKEKLVELWLQKHVFMMCPPAVIMTKPRGGGMESNSRGITVILAPIQ